MKRLVDDKSLVGPGSYEITVTSTARGGSWANYGSTRIQSFASKNTGDVVGPGSYNPSNHEGTK